jgi:hypothetical protein
LQAVYAIGDRAAADRAANRLAPGEYALATWRIEQERLEDVQSVIESLRQAGTPADSLAAAILEVRWAQKTGDAGLPALVASLDARLRYQGGGPDRGGHGNLTVALAFEALGDLERALAAARRYEVGNGAARDRFGPTFLRTQGRLAALLGRTDEAIEAYTTYLLVRADPEPAVQPEVEHVRAELNRLKTAAATGRPPIR